MGQGFSLATPSAGVAGIDVPELSDLMYEKSLGDGRFMKSVRARHHDGLVLVKVLVKPYIVKLDKYKKEIVRQRSALAHIPNAISFERVVETDTNGYLVRQFLYSSLYDRLSTRPFLEDVEKKWLAFQLLCALRDCHAQDIHHGDIKAQNILVTSWNWLYLSDFSSAFKPVVLPEDLPTDFSYYFDTSGRRTCYIAPERFVAAGQAVPADSYITWAMDIFSAGCVIAQMFLESEIFSLAQLFSYKQGKYDPVITHLSIIADKDLRDMIAHMIQLKPEGRYSAEQYLQFWRGKVFPEYFYSFLHGYMEHITDPASGVRPLSGAARNLGEPDERLDLIYNDFDKISYFLGHQNDSRKTTTRQARPRLGLGHFPVRLSIPGHEHAISDTMDPPEDDGTLIFLAVVLSSLRNTARAASKIRGCDVLLAFSERLTDEAKLDRVLPYLSSLLQDESELVVITAIRSITQLLQLVRIVTPINSHIFPDYIMARMEAVLRDKEGAPRGPLVRQTYASCLGSLAITALRFLEATGGLRTNGLLTFNDPEVELGLDADGAFDGPGDALRQLSDILEIHTKALVEDPDVHVRRAFLASVPDLCIFFAARSNDILLSHLNTYLNDRDWMLKCAFFETVVGIATLLGSVSVEEFILPLMLQALTDPEEYVVREVLHSLAQVTTLGLFSRAKTWELVELLARFTMHPNTWIREAATEFLSASTIFLTPADIRCIILPLVKPYLKPAIMPKFSSELALLDSLQKPLSRSVFDQAVQWALKADKGLWWKPLQQIRAFAQRTTLKFTGSARDELARAARNEEDEQWLTKLRSLGLGADEEFKLLALREFMWRQSMRKARETNDDASPTLNNKIINLQKLGVTLQTVMLYQEPQSKTMESAVDDIKAKYTIEDALMDASMAIDDAVAKRKRATINTHRTRLGSHGVLGTSPTDTRGTSSSGVSSAAREEEPYAHRRSVKHQSSALNLLDRRDSNKVSPETATTSANAFGQVEGPFTPPFSVKASSPTDEDMAAHLEALARARHSYEGHNPSILKMLNTIALENHPIDLPEFGPLVIPVTGNRTMVAAGTTTRQSPKTWAPKGGFVATFSEHRGPINRVVASPDHYFFITGGDDGTVRVWDSSRLERNITHRSKQVYRHAPGARVVALCFVEQTHTFVSAATDGSVHVVRVDVRFSHDNTLRYGKLQPIRNYAINVAGEHAVWIEHFKTDTHSVLMMATNRSRLMAVNLRNMETLYELGNPVHHGAPTCFCLDRKRNWLCVGTSHGVVDFWDLRFHVRLKAMGMPGRNAIHRLSAHPSRVRWICVAGGTGPGEVTIWDLDRGICREILRPAGTREFPSAYEFWNVDADKPEGMLSRFATAIEPALDSPASERGVRAMFVGSAAVEDPEAPASNGPSALRDIRGAFIITAGSDKKLRFWDLQQPQNSITFSGLRPDDQRPQYSLSSPTTSLQLYAEKLPRNNTAPSAGSSTATTAPGATRDRDHRSRADHRPASKPSRSTVISLHQQALMRGHLDAVLDITVLDVPYSVVVSVDRLGIVFVFQ